MKHSDNIEYIESQYKEAIDWLFARLPMFSRIGAAAYKPGLERVKRLSRLFGNPESKFKSIHIAGTNGKGSTSHIIAAVLQSAGYKTALYTSPHLVDFRERIRINGEMIPKQDVVDFVERWKRMENADSENTDRPSFFELTMMMAFDWFARQHVDYAVIEVGMGGRLDSTNIITPELSVITNISPDHTQFLGDTLAKIAGEKAGIIKPGVPVVIGEAEGEVEAVFESRAAETQSPLIKAYTVGIASDFQLKDDYSGWRFRSADFGDMELDLSGDYQQKNVDTALAAVKELSRKTEIPMSAVKEGFRNVSKITGLSGRWQILSNAPLTICDTGHNIGGLTWNMNTLSHIMKSKAGKLRMLMGFVSDKDVSAIMHILPREAVYYITNAQIPRAMPAHELVQKFRDNSLEACEYPDVPTTYAQILADSAPSDVIYIGGSTFIVADLLSTFG